MQGPRSLLLLPMFALALLAFQVRACAAQTGTDEPAHGGSAQLARPIDGQVMPVSQAWSVPSFAELRGDIWVLLQRLDSRAWLGRGSLAAGQPGIVPKRKSKLY